MIGPGTVNFDAGLGKNIPIKEDAHLEFRGDFFNLLKTPTQALLAIGDEGLLKELRGKVVRKRKLKTESRKGPTPEA